MTINGIKLRLRNNYISLTAKFRARAVKGTDFTIISNNCWGGLIYQSYDLPKQAPTVGMYFVAEEYVKFVSDLRHYVEDCPLTFINPEESRHRAFYAQDKRFGTYPIGRLGDVEIAFLHYHSEGEARGKWERRCKRIQWQRLIVKMNDQNLCRREHAEAFLALPFEHKLFFTVRPDFADIPGITFLKSKNRDHCGLFDEPFGSNRNFDLNAYINKLYH